MGHSCPSTWGPASLLLLVACVAPPQRSVVEAPVPTDIYKTSAHERALRRAFDGAPPVIPHETFPSPCTACHNREGVALGDVGFAPPSPHLETAGMSGTSRCRQCHVYRRDDTLWRHNGFRGLRQDLRQGRRLYAGAPPVLPHPVFMRENCSACHTGPAAREQIRTLHPERLRCRQCHIEQRTSGRHG